MSARHDRRGARALRFSVALCRMTGLVWRAQPACFAGLLALQLLEGVLPLGSAWVMKGLFDLLAARLAGEAAGGAGLVLLLLAQTGLALLSQLALALSGYLNGELHRRLALLMQVEIYAKLNSLAGLAPFEEPGTHSRIDLALQGIGAGPLRMLELLTNCLRHSVTVAAFLGTLIALSPSLAALLGLAVLPQLYAQLKLGGQRFGLAAGNSARARRCSYYATILSSVAFAKELRLFNLGGYFLNGFRRLTEELQQAERAQQWRELRWQAGLTLLSNLIATAAFALVLLRAFAGQLSLGDLTLYTGAVASVQLALSGLVYSLATMSQGVLFFRQYAELLALPQPLRCAPAPRAVPSLRGTIEFRQVSFRYSEQHPWVLRKLDLTIPAGSSLALVGLNGAGKTSLVKLLTRCYDPSEGQILWDGVDIREFDPQEFRRHLGAIFQDFNRYELSAAVNIGLGDVEQVDNLVRVERAAEQAGAAALVAALPQGYQTTLSRWLADDGPGVDLSGGEWQKLALARMFMRRSDLLILDEPTAALDVEAEHELYRRFVALVSGRTSLLISHRFSTVRLADRIAVLEGGRISEYGSHAELLARRGVYAELYRTQAEQYLDGALPRASRLAPRASRLTPHS